MPPPVAFCRFRACDRFSNVTIKCDVSRDSSPDIPEWHDRGLQPVRTPVFGQVFEGSPPDLTGTHGHPEIPIKVFLLIKPRAEHPVVVADDFLREYPEVSMKA